MRREARLHRSLSIDGLVRALDVHETPAGVPCVVLELIDGAPLSASNVTLSVLAEVAETLEALASEGIAHLDVKPENILVTTSGRACLLDLGLARRTPFTRTSDRAAGTPPYTAPEVFFGPTVDGRADQFALGVVALEVLTGHTPWHVAGHTYTDGALVPTMLVEDAPRLAASRPELGSELDEAIARAVSLDPANRHADTTTLARALRRAS